MAKLALCIGINDYPGTGSDLSGCVNDMLDWSAALGARGFDVRQLRDGEATKDAMVASIERLVADGKSGDTLLLTYSGHGSWIPDRSGDEPDGRDECLCPHDIAQNRPLVDDQLLELFSARAPKTRLVFISDSCHSGSVSRAAPPIVGDDAPQRIRFLPPTRFLGAAEAAVAERLARPVASGRPRHAALLLSGCRDTEYSYDARFNGRANGAFTYCALKSLKANMSYRDWYRAIREHLPSSSYPQSPNLYASESWKDWPALG
jgi:metacaspase-1